MERKCFLTNLTPSIINWLAWFTNEDQPMFWGSERAIYTISNNILADKQMKYRLDKMTVRRTESCLKYWTQRAVTSNKEAKVRKALTSCRNGPTGTLWSSTKGNTNSYTWGDTHDVPGQAQGSPLQSIFAEKNPEVLEDYEVEHDLALHPCGKESNGILGCIRRTTASRLRWPSPLLSTGETHFKDGIQCSPVQETWA